MEWEKEDIKTMKKFYNKIPVAELQKKLKTERTLGAIRQQAWIMKITKKNRNQYTGPKMLEIIIERQRKAGFLV